MGSRSLPGRIQATLRGRLPNAVIAWARHAATAFTEQLDDCHAVPHRTVVEPLARALGFSAVRRDLLGNVLDLLQTAFDVADNVADWPEDAGRQRRYTRHYRGIPAAALVCLPALLVGATIEILHEAFPAPEFSTPLAGQRLLQALGAMAVGQGTPTGARHVALVSGRQGSLLCLPAWLVAGSDARWRRRLAAVESWAYRFGQTWEYRQAHAERPSPASTRALARAMLAARRAWPEFSPFRPGEALAEDALVRPAVC